MLVSIPPEWDIIGDIRDCMLYPYSEGDYKQWEELAIHKGETSRIKLR